LAIGSISSRILDIDNKIVHGDNGKTYCTGIPIGIFQHLLFFSLGILENSRKEGRYRLYDGIFYLASFFTDYDPYLYDPFSYGFKESPDSIKGGSKDFLPKEIQRIKSKGMKQTVFKKHGQKNEVTPDAQMDIFIMGIGNNKGNEGGNDPGKNGDTDGPGVLL
jgi:hypothetical protein